MTFALRNYQQEGHDAVITALAGGQRSILLTAATGSGKTVLFSALIRTFLPRRQRVLVLAPRRDLISQAYLKIRNTCDLREEYSEIDKEMGVLHFDPSALVVVGCINTCYKEPRLQGWIPDVIICDEAHFCLSDMWTALFARFPVAIRIGVTATAMRGDDKPVFYEHIDGSKQILGEGKKSREALPAECAFQKHVYDYPIEDAIGDGWLVEPRVFVVRTKTDLSGVKRARNSAGDMEFNQRSLNEALERSDKTITSRINLAISVWKREASDRPTVVFCPSVKYAHWAAKLWQQAGFRAVAMDCETDNAQRDTLRQDIIDGKIQVACNFGLWTHGTDIPEWSCEVILRPTQSQALVNQMVGRVTRPEDRIAHALGYLPTAEERLALIAGSGKPDSIIIDVVDICGKHKLATVPTMLKLPPGLDLQGHKLTEAAKLVKEFDSVRAQVLHDCPATYEELLASIERVSILNKSGARHRDRWMVTEDGSFRHGRVPPGYQATLTQEGEQWRLQVTHGKKTLFEKAAKPDREVKEYFDMAHVIVDHAITEHKEAHSGRGTLDWIRGFKDGGRGTLYHLHGAKFTDEQIDRLTKTQVQAIVQPLRDAYFARKNQRFGTSRIAEAG